MVEYGPLVLQDAKLLVVDGAHKVGANEWAAIREAVLRVMKAGKAEADARTRLLLIFNPLSHDRRITRAMDTLGRPAQAIETVMDATSIARADLAIFVNAVDVTPEDVHVKQTDIPDENIPLLTSLCRYVWATGNYSVRFDDDAIDHILSEATRLHRIFHLTRLPLVSMDIDKKLARLSASIAAMTCSFSADWSELYVIKEHDVYVVNCLETEYNNAGLNALAAEERQEISPDEATILISNMKGSLKIG